MSGSPISIILNLGFSTRCAVNAHRAGRRSLSPESLNHDSHLNRDARTLRLITGWMLVQLSKDIRPYLQEGKV